MTPEQERALLASLQAQGLSEFQAQRHIEALRLRPVLRIEGTAREARALVEKERKKA